MQTIKKKIIIFSILALSALYGYTQTKHTATASFEGRGCRAGAGMCNIEQTTTKTANANLVYYFNDNNTVTLEFITANMGKEEYAKFLNTISSIQESKLMSIAENISIVNPKTGELYIIEPSKTKILKTSNSHCSTQSNTCTS